MKTMSSFLKIVSCLTVGVFMWASCNKDKVDVPNDETTGAYTKAADKVAYGEAIWGEASNWLGKNGVLNFLHEGRNLWNTTLGQEIASKEVPSGFIVTAEEGSDVFVTCVGGDASFKSILGYYTYQNGDNLTDADLLSRIFDTDESGNSYFKQVIFKVPEEGTEFSQTYKLGFFPKGTVIGFYLVPNSVSSNVVGDKVIPKYDDKGRAIFIATDRKLNKTIDNYDGGEKLSHIVGRSECGDLVVSFEDLNSMYSKTSDEDYNDLVIVVGCEKDSRTNKNIMPYPLNTVPNPTGLDVEILFGDNACFDKILCEEGIIDMVSLINNISYKYQSGKPLDEKDELYDVKLATYKGVWEQPYKQYLDFEGLGMESIPLYAKVAYRDAGNPCIFGWFPYDAATNTIDQALEKILIKNTRNIDPKYIIAYVNKNVNTSNNGAIYKVTIDGQDLYRLGGNNNVTFSATDKIGFFILSHGGLDNGVPKDTWSTGVYNYPTNVDNNRNPYYIFKCTSIRNNPNDTPTAILVGSKCSSLIIAFEDLMPLKNINNRQTENSADNDYNDVIFHVTDNTSSLTWETQGKFMEKITGDFYPLETLNALFIKNGLKP